MAHSSQALAPGTAPTEVVLVRDSGPLAYIQDAVIYLDGTVVGTLRPGHKMHRNSTALIAAACQAERSVGSYDGKRGRS